MLEIEYLKNDIEKLLQLLGSVPEVFLCLDYDLLFYLWGYNILPKCNLSYLPFFLLFLLLI